MGLVDLRVQHGHEFDDLKARKDLKEPTGCCIFPSRIRQAFFVMNRAVLKALNNGEYLENFSSLLLRVPIQSKAISMMGAKTENGLTFIRRFFAEVRLLIVRLPTCPNSPDTFVPLSVADQGRLEN